MKAKHSEFARGLPRSASQASIFFFCGPDEAGASAAADKIIAALPDAGERIELSGGDLKRDPALLGDEARSGSLFGDKRHILARVTGEEAHDALKALIETSDSGAGDAAPILVIATSATDKSRTAKLLEKRPDALVTMFHPPDLGSVAGAVRSMADAAGLRLGGDLAERIARSAGLDVRLAQSEVDKLALYLDASSQTPKSATPEDLAAIGAPTEDDGFAPLVNAVLGGELGKLPSELRRMKELGINPVGLLLALERRAGQLTQITAKLGPRGNFDNLGKGEKAQLGVFWKEEREIRQQLGRWPARKLGRLIPRLAALHQSLLANSQAAELLLAQDLTQIARFAAKR
ncbi:DNA polymerase III subunit delta [Erythrobacter sp. SCSIO 43205]|uniref:DNA polymerase III subunit delta n=1 Tax=Erythrobacter sp. SCSIO 43205 TaxID=2779361 RepID=UPI001CA94C2D|nr:DNA polymerase III subunit delta [Erythrobacter sp. SCSIO 43205]UAB78588.1 DNA polymerase III subunit delta [Erythrobacter sp. SCSIO 43205]